MLNLRQANQKTRRSFLDAAPLSRGLSRIPPAPGRGGSHQGISGLLAALGVRSHLDSVQHLLGDCGEERGSRGTFGIPAVARYFPCLFVTSELFALLLLFVPVPGLTKRYLPAARSLVPVGSDHGDFRVPSGSLGATPSWPQLERKSHYQSRPRTGSIRPHIASCVTLSTPPSWECTPVPPSCPVSGTLCSASSSPHWPIGANSGSKRRTSHWHSAQTGRTTAVRRVPCFRGYFKLSSAPGMRRAKFVRYGFPSRGLSVLQPIVAT